MSVLPWLVCPECEYDDFEEDDIQTDRAICPDCGASTPLHDIDNEPSMEDLLSSLGDDEPTANDKPEVEDSELVFSHEEPFYRAGTQPFYCPNCGDECALSCSLGGRKDVAYCTTCHVQYKRNRVALVDDISEGITTKTPAEKRDAYEEYDCEHCDEHHAYTRPEGTYSSPSQKVRSYEQTWFDCLCGQRLSGAFEPTDVVECPNCPRRYTLDVEFLEQVSDEYGAFDNGLSSKDTSESSR